MNKLPGHDEMMHMRNGLINALLHKNVSMNEIKNINISCVMNRGLLRIEGEDGCAIITLIGTELEKLNGWQTLRPRANPKDGALFIALRGKHAGQRLSLSSIRRIARQAGSKALNVRFSERLNSEHPKKAVAEIIQNRPALRLVHGGRR